MKTLLAIVLAAGLLEAQTPAPIALGSQTSGGYWPSVNYVSFQWSGPATQLFEMENTPAVWNVGSNEPIPQGAPVVGRPIAARCAPAPSFEPPALRCDLDVTTARDTYFVRVRPVDGAWSNYWQESSIPCGYFIGENVFTRTPWILPGSMVGGPCAPREDGTPPGTPANVRVRP